MPDITKITEKKFPIPDSTLEKSVMDDYMEYYNNPVNVEKRKVGGHTKSKMGYRDDSPYKNEPYIDINTPTGEIDMSNTGTPLMANGRYLAPYSGTHRFDSNVVRETPIKKNGGQINNYNMRNNNTWLDQLQEGGPVASPYATINGQQATQYAGLGGLDNMTDYNINYEPNSQSFVYEQGGYLPQAGKGGKTKKGKGKFKKWLQTGDADGDGKRTGFSNMLWKGADAATETAGNAARIADPLNIGYGKAARRGMGNVIGDDRHQKGLDQATDFSSNIVGGAAKGVLNAVPGGSIITGLGEKVGGYTNNAFQNPEQEYAGQNKWEGYGNSIGQVAGGIGVAIASGGTLAAGGVGSAIKGAGSAMETADEDKWGKSRGTNWGKAAQGANVIGSAVGMLGGDASGALKAAEAGANVVKAADTVGRVGNVAGIGTSFIPEAQSNNIYGYNYGGGLPKHTWGSDIKDTWNEGKFKNFFVGQDIAVDGGIGQEFEGPPEIEDVSGAEDDVATSVRRQQDVNFYNPYDNNTYGYKGGGNQGFTEGSSLDGYSADMTNMPHGGLYEQGGSLQEINPQAEYEIEQGELIYHPNNRPVVLENGGLTQNSDEYSYAGNGTKHSDPTGGMQMAGGKEGYILSDDPKMQVPDELIKELKYLT